MFDSKLLGEMSHSKNIPSEKSYCNGSDSKNLVVRLTIRSLMETV